MSFANVASVLGWALAALAAAMALSAGSGTLFGEGEAAAAFAVAAMLTGFVAGLLVLTARARAAPATKRENVAATVGVLLVLPVFAALPMFTSGAVASVTDAYFEAVSGLTTTGATVIAGLDGADRTVLLWRALLQWLGGIGTVILVILHLAHLGVGGMQLYSGAIVHGDQDPLMIRLKETGAPVVAVYAVLTALCFIALAMTGLPAFDAIAHALTAVSTGGFSTRDGSVGAFASPAVEAVLVVFMILGATNASLHWMLLRRQGAAVYRRDPEFLYFLWTSALAAAVIAAALIVLGGTGAGAAVRHGVFAAVSAITTTGFAGGSEVGWPLFVPAFLLVLMIAGGCTGSTAGGLKTMRLLILFQLTRREMARLAHPHSVKAVRYGGAPVDPAAVRAVWAFFVVLVFGFAVLTLGLALTGSEFRAAAFAAAGAVSNTGPIAAQLAGDAAHAADLAPAAKVLLCLGMLLGRIEFFTALILFNPRFWRR
jgi:trk system potassium uptake protein TrkH